MLKRNKLFETFLIVITFLIFNIHTIALDSTSGVASLNNDIYSSLKEAVEIANEGDTIELINDTTETQVINVNKGITINGNGHKIISNSLKGTEAAFLINTSSKTIINDLIIETNTRGIALNNSTHNLIVKNSTLNVGQRGITVNSNKNSNSTLIVEDSLIQNTNVKDYNEEVPNNDSRGISLWEYSDSNISVKNTTIQGFSYVINITAASSFYNSNNTNVIIDNCQLKGRAGINYSNTSGLTISLKDSEILGINNQTGTSERFGNIVIYQNGNATLNIENTKLINYQNEIGTSNPSALQYMLDIRSTNSTIKISGNTSGIDTTGKLDSVIILASNENNIEITGGSYSYNVEKYIPDGYECNLINEMYQVKKVVPIPTIDIEELDLNTPTNETIVGLINKGQTQKTLIDTITTNPNLADKNLKVTIDITTSVTDDDKEDFNNNKIISNAIISSYYDITINVLDASNNNVIENLSELKDKITFAIILPEELKSVNNGYQRKYYVLRKHNNKYEVLTASLASDGKYLTFESDKFSNYALIYVDEKITTSSKPSHKNEPTEIEDIPSDNINDNQTNIDNSTNENPKTHDSISIYYAVCGVSLIYLACIKALSKLK
ncbi:MAG: hypothetical protein NC483_05850 [Ruminococcus sp.]|nr:hypothetical protein [Ruminococcus sp.]